MRKRRFWPESFLASAGFLFMERQARQEKDEQPGQLPRIAFAVITRPKARIGERIWFRFRLTNLGDTPIRNLALRGIGDWESFHIEVVDVDGVFERHDSTEWFLLGQEVRSGKKRKPLIGLVPRVAGIYRFVFHATDGRRNQSASLVRCGVNHIIYAFMPFPTRYTASILWIVMASAIRMVYPGEQPRLGRSLYRSPQIVPLVGSPAPT
ncbi:MAG: hypothetical protein GX493_03615 [Firmicutes bacterium]|nr:hypothetical protein [Bacillota bacterium]